mmetsp:Transcript_45079/g.134563  ORF Transcript_45079/g.134563 Transcript_45079/m.134563 type:complete len:343 (-) Transcript_45079:34-1062(-)
MLQALNELVVLHALLLAHALQHLLDAWHHALEATEVHVAARVAQQVKDLVGILLNLVLDVHLATALVLLPLAGQSVVQAEVLGAGGSDLLQLVIVQLAIRVRSTHEQPEQASELVVWHIFKEQAAPERAERRNASAGGSHDNGGVGVLRQQQHLAGGAGHHDLRARGSVAQEVGADTLLGWVIGLHLRVPVGGTAHAQRRGVAVERVTVAGRRDGVQAHAMGHLLATRVHLRTRGDDAVGLALPEGDLAVGLDDNVAGLACGLGAHNALDRLNAGLERSLVVVRVERHLALLQLQRHRRLGNLGRGRLGPDGHSAARAGAASDRALGSVHAHLSGHCVEREL